MRLIQNLEVVCSILRADVICARCRHELRSPAQVATADQFIPPIDRMPSLPFAEAHVDVSEAQEMSVDAATRTTLLVGSQACQETDCVGMPAVGRWGLGGCSTRDGAATEYEHEHEHELEHAHAAAAERNANPDADPDAKPGLRKRPRSIRLWRRELHLFWAGA
eukprot:1497571-Rhodomonas_salina.2